MVQVWGLGLSGTRWYVSCPYALVVKTGTPMPDDRLNIYALSAQRPCREAEMQEVTNLARDAARPQTRNITVVSILFSVTTYNLNPK